MASMKISDELNYIFLETSCPRFANRGWIDALRCLEPEKKKMEKKRAKQKEKLEGKV